MENLTLNVQGMTCSGCVNSVKRVLSAIPGVSQVDVVLETGKVSLVYDATQASPDQFKEAVRDAGYQVV